MAARTLTAMLNFANLAASVAFYRRAAGFALTPMRDRFHAMREFQVRDRDSHLPWFGQDLGPGCGVPSR